MYLVHLITVLMIPLVVVPLGYIMWRFPPKRMSSTYGYRTRRAMASQEAWDEAQRYSGWLIALMGTAGGAIGVIIVGLHPDDWVVIIGAVMLQTLLLMATVPVTEGHLKRLERLELLRPQSRP